MELELYTVAFFWVPYSVRNVLTKFDIFSQLARPVGKLNKQVHLGFFFFFFFKDSMILV